jgi:hypothetical protein
VRASEWLARHQQNPPDVAPRSQAGAVKLPGLFELPRNFGVQSFFAHFVQASPQKFLV